MARDTLSTVTVGNLNGRENDERTSDPPEFAHTNMPVGIGDIASMIVRKPCGMADMVFIPVASDTFEPCGETVDFINTCVKVPILSGSIYPTEEWIMKKQLPVGRDEEKTAAA